MKHSSYAIIIIININIMLSGEEGRDIYWGYYSALPPPLDTVREYILWIWSATVAKNGFGGVGMIMESKRCFQGSESNKSFKRVKN